LRSSRFRLKSVAYDDESPEVYGDESPEVYEDEGPEVYDDVEADPDPAFEKRKGVVKWFDPRKGYGFITPDDGAEDLFVHQTSILCSGYRSLRDGEAVEFDTDDSEDGRLRAVQVTGPEGAEPLGASGSDPYMDGRASSSRYTSEPYSGLGKFSSGLQLVVHNVPWSVTSDRLLDTFQEFAPVDAEIMYDELGRSRGYGVVKFDNKEKAEQALETLHMTELDGRNIMVRYDRYG